MENVEFHQGGVFLRVFSPDADKETRIDFGDQELYSHTLFLTREQLIVLAAFINRQLDQL
jgi:hypothetical protein